MSPDEFEALYEMPVEPEQLSEEKSMFFDLMTKLEIELFKQRQNQTLPSAYNDCSSTDFIARIICIASSNRFITGDKHIFQDKMLNLAAICIDAIDWRETHGDFPQTSDNSFPNIHAPAFDPNKSSSLGLETIRVFLKKYSK